MIAHIARRLLHVAVSVCQLLTGVVLLGVLATGQSSAKEAGTAGHGPWTAHVQRLDRHRRARMLPCLHPVALSIVGLVLGLRVSGVSYEQYFDSASLLHFLLGPATVALAVPLYVHAKKVRAALLPLFGALVVGSCTVVISALGLAHLLRVSQVMRPCLSVKSVTMPIALGVAAKIGAVPELTAVLVVTTGILGAMLGKSLLDLMGIKDDRARGFALGLAAHGIGTARAFQISEVAGTFSGLAMGLNGIVTALSLPIFLHQLGIH